MMFNVVYLDHYQTADAGIEILYYIYIYITEIKKPKKQKQKAARKKKKEIITKFNMLLPIMIMSRL